MKVLRDGDVHTIKELTARVLLEGAFERSYTASDNTSVVATDTMKNTLYVLAHDHLELENEPFTRRVATHFLERHAHVSRVTVELGERVWTRLQVIGGEPAHAHGHPHSFIQSDVMRPFTHLQTSRAIDGIVHEQKSGVRDLIVLKSSQSGFEGFHRDEFTTLPETHERILASAVRAEWTWEAGREPASYRAAQRAIVRAMLVPFAERYSPSVQATLFEMATAALEACPEVARVTLSMPNLHCLPVELGHFGRTNHHEIFVPTDEPHGDIEATVSRG